MRRFLSRVAFALIVIAAVLTWEIHKGMQRGTLTGVKQGLMIAAAILCFSLGAAGMKERHRRDPGA